MQLAEITSKEEEQDIVFSINNQTNNGCLDKQFWFGLVSKMGTLWFSGSRSNVSYKNFDRFDVPEGEEHRCQVLRTLFN